MSFIIAASQLIEVQPDGSFDINMLGPALSLVGYIVAIATAGLCLWLLPSLLRVARRAMTGEVKTVTYEQWRQDDLKQTIHARIQEHRRNGPLNLP